jgi:hypothetical protein
MLSRDFYPEASCVTGEYKLQRVKYNHGSVSCRFWVLSYFYYSGRTPLSSLSITCFMAQTLFCCTSQFLSPFFRAEFGFAGLQSASLSGRRSISIERRATSNERTSTTTQFRHENHRGDGKVETVYFHILVISDQIPFNTDFGA